MTRASLFTKPAAAPVAPVVVPAPITAPDAPKLATQPGRKYPLASTREGKRVATVYLEPEAWMQLQMIALEEGTTLQALMAEGANHVFEKRGKSRIA